MEQGYIYRPKTLETFIESTEKLDEQKYLVWHIQGGLGKNVAATALVKDIKEKYNDRKFILVCSWPEVFLNNPYIDRVYQLGQTPHFYEDYIENKDVIIFRQEPYFQTGHITRRNHILKSWSELLGIDYKNQIPVLYPSYVQKKTNTLWIRQKPILVIQTNGGPLDNQLYGYSWTRDMPIEIAQDIVSRYKNEYHIIQVTRPNGYVLSDVERVDKTISNIELFGLLVSSKKRVLIDSCLQHASVALNLKSTVLWIGTSPINFGYNFHNNIQSKLTKRQSQLIGSYLFDYQFENNLHECPYENVSDMFDIQTIFNSIDNI